MPTESGCRGEEDYLNTGVILFYFKGVLQCHSCSDAKTSLSYCMELGGVQGNWFTGQGQLAFTRELWKDDGEFHRGLTVLHPFLWEEGVPLSKMAGALTP